VAKGKFDCGFYKSESAKLLENRDCLRFVENKIKPKTCKIYSIARKPLFLQHYFAITIEWE
jgi:hypothetical protein